jgi:hypothetical protein
LLLAFVGILFLTQCGIGRKTMSSNGKEEDSSSSAGDAATVAETTKANNPQEFSVELLKVFYG